MSSSRIPAFYRLTVDERRARLAELAGLSPDDRRVLEAADALSMDAADLMIENAVGRFTLPFGIGLNFQVNGRDYLVPMVVEEPSVIAAASNAALVARSAGGFIADADPGAMIGQIQLIRVPDPVAAAERLERARPDLLAEADALTPGLCRRGGGPRDIEIRLVDTPRGERMVVFHILLDTGDAMGANAVNSLVEALAPRVAAIAGGEACLRILSNLADRRRARASVRVPTAALGRDGVAGEEVAERMVYAYELAWADPYRAATHNKGIMNGIDAIALATGNDWRAIEAGAHAWACRDGAYRSLTAWSIERDHLIGSIELPLGVSTVGPAVEAHPHVKLAFRILDVETAGELACVMAVVGLASNMAAMRALATEGIQKGHMALHARAVSHAAGARGEEAEQLRRLLIEQGDVKIDRARELLRASTRRQ
jgi:hydroxymethylglutaryl-CoA reductase